MNIKIMDNIVNRLRNKDLLVGSKLDTISKFAKEFNCSETTAKKTLNSMVLLGILRKRQGSGYFVESGWDTNLITSPRRRYSVKLDVKDMKIKDDDPNYGKYFNFSNAAWEKHVKTYKYNDQLVAINCFSLKSALLRKYNYEDKKNASLISWIYDFNIRNLKESTEFKLRLATDEELKWFNLKKGAYVVVETTITLKDDEALLLTYIISHPDYFTYKKKKHKL